MKLFSNTFEKIKARKIRKWAAVYLSAAITIIGVVHLFSFRYELPSYLFDTVLIFIILGFFTVLVVSWFHGEPGSQRVKFKEVILHSLIFLLALSVVYNYVYRPAKIKTYSIEANSIAVLPFTNMSGEKEDEYFSDGVTEDILTQLSKLSGLKVISRTSVMKYKNTTKNIREISKELGVETVLEGSVRRAGNNVRVVAQLIDAINDAHIWSETYDRNMEDIFAIQSEIAEKIAATLQTKLLPLEKEIIEKDPAENIEAYTYYLKGRHYYNNYNEEDNERAIEMFGKALEIDSNYAPALAGLADSYNQRVTKYWQSDVMLDSALEFSKKAIQLDPRLPEAYKAAALTYDNLSKKELALSNYEKAIKLNPNYAIAISNYGHIKNKQGKYGEALYWFGRAVQLEPDNIWTIMSTANVYKFLGCDSLAIEWGNKALSLDSENPVLNLFAGDIYLYAGDFNKAKALLKKTMRLNNKMFLSWFFYGQVEIALGNYESAKEYIDSSFTLAGAEPEYFTGFLLKQLNNPDSADSILQKEEKDYREYLYENSGSAVVQDYLALAEIYAIQDEKEKAFEAWREAVNKGWIDVKRVSLFPYFENLEDYPEYRELLNIMMTKVEKIKNTIREKYPETEICG